MSKNMSISCYSLQKSGDSSQTSDTIQSPLKSQKKSVLLILNQSKVIDQIPELHPKLIFPTGTDNSRSKIFIECPACRQQAETIVTYQNGYYTYCCAILLTLICFPAAFIPFCKVDCQDAIQHCSRCAAIVGEAKYQPC